MGTDETIWSAILNWLHGVARFFNSALRHIFAEKWWNYTWSVETKVSSCLRRHARWNYQSLSPSSSKFTMDAWRLNASSMVSYLIFCAKNVNATEADILDRNNGHWGLRSLCQRVVSPTCSLQNIRTLVPDVSPRLAASRFDFHRSEDFSENLWGYRVDEA